MKIFPAIDIRHGDVVQLVGGDPSQVAVAPDATVGQQAQKWREAGAKRLHVIDLDAALGEERQWRHLSAAIETGLPVQFGGGVRSMLDIQKLIELGVKQVIVGTQAVKNPEWTRELCRVFPGRVILAVDGRGRDLVVSGWTESSGKDVVDFAASLDDAGLGGFLYTNVSKEGRLEGVDIAVLRALRDATPKTPLIASGGFRNMDDLQAACDIGIDGVVLGMSIYTGSLDLKEAVKRFEQAEVIR